MSQFLLREHHMAPSALHFLLAHGVPRVSERRALSGIVYVS